MYIAELRIENFRCFGAGDNKLILPLRPGLTALVGENDSGKTAVIDALRLVLGTRDQEFLRVQESDFHFPSNGAEREREIKVRCKFMGLTRPDKASFAEYLTYVEIGGGRDVILYVNCIAKNIIRTRGRRRFIAVEVRSGENGDGPAMDPEARNSLRATYLRPLRDAERAMAAGRGSRLSQILQYTKEIREVGEDFDPEGAVPDVERLSVLGVGDYASALIRGRKGITEARKRLNEDYLDPLSFAGNSLVAEIDVHVSGDKEARLRQQLEKLELELRDTGARNAVSNRGLGSNNLLFMACELLLLGAEEEEFPLLVVEEPEAHLHPQRQLRLMQFLQEHTEMQRENGQQLQVVITTHSPNLASAIKLENMILLDSRRAFSLHSDVTELEASDYRFLARFLDATKANLFFARGVVMVEGDGENVLLPTLARLIGRDFTEHGVSIVNVGGTGLRRFSRIFQRKDPAADGTIQVPVACVTDLDVMPDCAPVIVGRLRDGEPLPKKADRRWRIRSDFGKDELEARIQAIRAKADGQKVTTFVSDEWTLEYDLAYAGLARDLWVAAKLAIEDDRINAGKRSAENVTVEAEAQFAQLNGDVSVEELASRVYALFTTGTRASKAVCAQYLADRLQDQVVRGELDLNALRSALPKYLVKAIEHVTSSAGNKKPELEAELVDGR